MKLTAALGILMLLKTPVQVEQLQPQPRVRINPNAGIQVPKPSEGPAVDVRAEQINMILEDITTALNSFELEEAVRRLNELINDHGERFHEGKTVPLIALEFLQNGPDGLRDLWNRHYVIDAARFKSKGTMPVQALLKFSMHEDVEAIYRRMIPILQEGGDLAGLAETLIVARELGLDTDVLEEAFLRVVDELEAGPRLTWVLGSWMSPLIPEEQVARLRKRFAKRAVEKSGDSVRVTRAERASNHSRWESDLTVEGTLKKRRQNINSYYQMIKPDDDPGMTFEGQFHVLSRMSDESRTLWALEADTGRALWSHEFEAPAQGTLLNHVGAEGEAGYFHLVAWQALKNVRNSYSYISDGVMRDRSGNLLWEFRVEDHFPEGETLVPVGDPVMHGDRLYIPFFNLSEYGWRGGTVYLRLACLSTVDGSVHWLRDVNEFSFQRRVMQNTVDIEWYEGAVICHTGLRRVTAVDGADGRVLWSTGLDDSYKASGIQPPQMQRNYYRRGNNPDPITWNSQQGFLVRMGADFLVRDDHGYAVFLVSGDSGEVRDVFRLPNNKHYRWVRWLDDGALLIGPEGGVHLRVEDGEFKFRLLRGHLPTPIVDLLPWGPGVLVNSGADLTEMTWKPGTDTLEPRRVADGSQTQRLTTAGGSLIMYGNDKVRSLALFPPTLEGIRRLWDSGQRTAELALMILEEDEFDSWNRQKAFVDELPAELRNDDRLEAWLLGKLFFDLRTGKLAQCRERLRHMDPEGKNAHLKFINDCLVGLEPESPKEPFQIGHNHSVTGEALRIMIKRQINRVNDVLKPVPTRAELAPAWEFATEVELTHNRVGPSINGNWICDYSRRSVINRKTGKMIRTKGVIAAWGPDRVVIQEGTNIVMRKFTETGLADEPTWSAPLTTFGPHASSAIATIHQIRPKPYDHYMQNLFNLPYKLVEDTLLVQKGKRLSAFDADSGLLIWSKPMAAQFCLGQSRTDRRYLYLMAKAPSDDNVQLIKLDLAAGIEEWTAYPKIRSHPNMRNVNGSMADLGGAWLVSGYCAWGQVDKKTGEVTNVTVPNLNYRTRPTLYAAGRSRLVFQSSNWYNYYNLDGSFIGPLSGGVCKVTWYDRDRILVHHGHSGKIELVNLSTGKTEKTMDSGLKDNLMLFKRIGPHVWMMGNTRRQGNIRTAVKLDVATGDFEEVKGEWYSISLGEGAVGLMARNGRTKWFLYTLPGDVEIDPAGDKPEDAPGEPTPEPAPDK